MNRTLNPASTVRATAWRRGRVVGFLLVPILMLAGLSGALVASTRAAASVAAAGYLPFPNGQRVYVQQGNGGSFSHDNFWDRYAWDFTNPDGPTVGMTVTSATGGGTVAAVRDGYTGNICGQTGAFNSPYASGNYVLVHNTDGTYSQYLHLQSGSVKVAPGDLVSTGQKLAQVGETGNACGAHLHYGWVLGPISNGVGQGGSTPGSFIGIGIPAQGSTVTSNTPTDAAPAVAVETSGHQRVFYRAADGAVMMMVWDGKWEASKRINDPAKDPAMSGPAATYNAALHQINVYWAGKDHHLWTRYLNTDTGQWNPALGTPAVDTLIGTLA